MTDGSLCIVDSLVKQCDARATLADGMISGTPGWHFAAAVFACKPDQTNSRIAREKSLLLVASGCGPSPASNVIPSGRHRRPYHVTQVRDAWRANPAPFNDIGQMAALFRADIWPGKTEGVTPY